MSADETPAGLEATPRDPRHRDGDALPIVAMTAHAATEEADPCRDAGMNDFLTKPFKAHRLYEVIERWSGDGKRPIIERGDRDVGPRVPGGGPR